MPFTKYAKAKAEPACLCSGVGCLAGEGVECAAAFSWWDVRLDAMCCLPFPAPLLLWSLVILALYPEQHEDLRMHPGV